MLYLRINVSSAYFQYSKLVFFFKPPHRKAEQQHRSQHNLTSRFYSKAVLLEVRRLKGIDIWQVTFRSTASEPNQPSSCPDAPNGSRTVRGQKQRASPAETPYLSSAQEGDININKDERNKNARAFQWKERQDKEGSKKDQRHLLCYRSDCSVLQSSLTEPISLPRL